MVDDYNIGNFGEFDRFEDERAFMPEAFERPQSTIGGYDKKFGYTLPSFENENPDNWFWGYNNPDDAVQEQQHGVWPSIKRNSPEWVKDIGRGLHDTGKLYYDHGMFSDDILDFFGWQPQDNYYNESMNERFNEDYISEALEGIGKKANPYKGALPGAIMGDPFRYSSEDMAPNDWLADEIWGDQSKIDLQDIFRRYPGIDLWRLIQNLDARGIEYANRGGIIGLL